VIILPICKMGRGTMRSMVEGYARVGAIPFHHRWAMAPLPTLCVGRI
jgi:hypothetical protein